MEHQVVSSKDWLSARVALLKKEKELTRLRDELAAERRKLPWERVEKKYVFDGPAGKESLSDLFGDRSQLVIYHFMFTPDGAEGCKSCSFWADNFERGVIHLAHRDVTMIAVSRAAVAKLAAFKKRLGWTFKWVSSGGNDFNYDYKVSFHPGEKERMYNYTPLEEEGPEWPGVSVFYKNDSGELFHTYSTFGRGIEPMNATYQYLDLVPKGRDESALSFSMEWVRHWDRYDDRR